MKFGRQLEEVSYPGYKQYYIAYKDLKKAIKHITGEVLHPDDSILLSNAGPITRTPESHFQELLDRELTKINNFSAVQFSALTEEVRELIYRLTHPSRSIETETKEAVASLHEEIAAFDEYIRLNFTGFRKALKKFDKWNKSDSSRWFLQRIVRSDFMLIPIDRLLFGLSIVESLRRNTSLEDMNACNSSELAIHKSPLFFKRTKYFISPDDLVKVEIDLLKECNAIYAYPLSQTIPTEFNHLAQAFSGGRSRHINAEIGFTEFVVIFENESFTQTAARRGKKPFSDFTGGYAEPVFSIRWNQAQNREGKCTIVRESHPKVTDIRQSTLGFQLEIGQRTVSDLISKKIPIEKLTEGHQDSTDFLAEFSTCLSKSYPSALYSYRRTLLQWSDSITIALDRDIKFLDLKTVAPSSIFSAQISQFQSMLSQRVMTVWQSRNLDSLPDFLAAIVGKPSVSEVAGFSKAIHAETILHVVADPNGPGSVGLPRWFIHTVSAGDAEGMKMTGADDDFSPSPLLSPASGKFDVLPKMEANSKLIIHDIVSAKEPKQITAIPSDSSGRVDQTVIRRTPLPSVSPLLASVLEQPLLQRSANVQPGHVKRSLIDHIKYILFGSIAPVIPEPTSNIEPKTFLANERTFLNWCYVSFILQAAAVTLVSVDGRAHLEGSLLSLVALVTLGWSLNVYRLRVIALRSMRPLDALLVSSNGASLVCLSVVFALTVTWMGRVKNYLAVEIIA